MKPVHSHYHDATAAAASGGAAHVSPSGAGSRSRVSSAYAQHPSSRVAFPPRTFDDDGRHREKADKKEEKRRRDIKESRPATTGGSGNFPHKQRAILADEHTTAARNEARDRPYPRVLVLDLDGTMIGKIIPQVCEYEILNVLHKPKHLKALRKDITERLKQGILRPHLKWMCAQVKSGRIERLELFVYTASETKWANFLVPCVEDALDFKFHRPLFTRKECVMHNSEFKKSLASISPAIYRKLKTKYKLKSVGDVESNLVLIDNNPGVLLHPASESRRLIRCPTYDFAYYYDVLQRVDLDVLHARYHRIIPVLVVNCMFPNVRASEVRDILQFVFMYYHKMAENSKLAWREHSSNADGKERLWRIVGEALRDNNGADFSEYFVSMLNRRIIEAQHLGQIASASSSTSSSTTLLRRPFSSGTFFNN